MKIGYLIEVFIPVDLHDFRTLERVSAVHQGILDFIGEDTIAVHAGIEVSEPKHVRKRVPAPITPASAEPAAQDAGNGGSPEPAETSEGTGAVAAPIPAAPAADHMPGAPGFLVREQ